MDTRRFLAAALFAVVAATAVAAPAAGQTQQQIDQAFLSALGERGIPVKDDAKTLDLAHRTCDLLNNGGTTDAALQLIQKAEKKWSREDVVNFGGLALYAYCREHLPQ
ncbi:DUF732 domain-containing protein [Mycolicibacterium flavescens]|uniref:DUF732 domain-containing protein n=1 Tax=Mycolicibacterium flavescens TaxID=1776 RepID=A0A1E3RJS9_MYCFV|nr:DUF732 domain-containing protein [Mycolicibacterium flavescens]MCV7282487.1 DUF732 domain-containing protein [Mycolicibacterium flavescens]ODQ90123.1 hypothetical protein BHQ18_11820 [Mycolicibacterium flavescens]